MCPCAQNGHMGWCSQPCWPWSPVPGPFSWVADQRMAEKSFSMNVFAEQPDCGLRGVAAARRCKSSPPCPARPVFPPELFGAHHADGPGSWLEVASDPSSYIAHRAPEDAAAGSRAHFPGAEMLCKKPDPNSPLAAATITRNTRTNSFWTRGMGGAAGSGVTGQFVRRTPQMGQNLSSLAQEGFAGEGGGCPTGAGNGIQQLEPGYLTGAASPTLATFRRPLHP